MKNPKVSTEFYDPKFFTGGPSERSRTMFGDADIQGNLTSGFSYQDLLKFLDANPNTLAETNRPGAGGGVYEKVRIGAKQEQDAAARQQEELARQQKLDRIASRAEAQQQKEAAAQQQRLRAMEIASRNAERNQLAGSRTAELQLQSTSRLPGSQGGTGAFKRKAMQIKPQVSTGLSPGAILSSMFGINV